MNVRREIASIGAPREFLMRLVNVVATILRSKVGIAGKRGTRWVVAAESNDGPRVPIPADEDGPTLEQLSATNPPVALWRTPLNVWTLVSLTESAAAPVVLVVEGDWTASANVLVELARSLSRGSRYPSRRARPLDDIARQLTRALADTTGMSAIAAVVLRHVLEAVPSGVASLAVATSDSELSIAATYGYPRAFVDHLRIAAGSGVIGSTQQTRTPLIVSDVRTTRNLDRRRSRYRTHSFAAIPIVAGTQSLGVISLTERIAEGPYTQEDAAAISVLMAPAALALGRERLAREARTHAQAAMIDLVSGLFNRRYFQVRLDEELQRGVRQMSSVALLLVDLDGFKSVNDRFGHVTGDQVIRDISDILRRSVRIFDVCTRFGGEEFAVMMPGGTTEGAGAIAERIRHRVETYQPGERELSALQVTASIGVAVSPPGATAHELIERADRALYHAKATGKNRVHISP